MSKVKLHDKINVGEQFLHTMASQFFVQNDAFEHAISSLEADKAQLDLLFVHMSKILNHFYGIRNDILSLK